MFVVCSGMGARTDNRTPMGWQGSLGEMIERGTSVFQTCSHCHWRDDVDLAALESRNGSDYMLWDKQPPCPSCGQRTHFMASPALSTPYRPLLSGLLAEEARRRFLRSFGFTPRDVLRIQRLAESATNGFLSKALDDLDVPYRVGACMPAEAARFSGQVLGEWAGRTLLWWRMNEREEEIWRQKRRTGPKPMP